MTNPFDDIEARCCRCSKEFIASPNTLVYVSPHDDEEYHYLCPRCQETLTDKQIDRWYTEHVLSTKLSDV